MRLKSRPRHSAARRNPSELFIINPHTPGRRPQMRRRNPSLIVGRDGRFLATTPSGKRMTGIAFKAPKKKPSRTKRKAAPKKGKGKATMAKRRRKSKVGKSRKSAKRVKAGKKAARTRARNKSAKRSVRRNPRRKRRTRRNPLVTTSAYKRFSFVGRGRKGGRFGKARRKSRKQAHALLKKGEAVILRTKSKNKNKRWRAGSVKAALRATAPKRRRKRKSKAKSGHRKSAKRVAAGKKAARTRWAKAQRGAVYVSKRRPGLNSPRMNPKPRKRRKSRKAARRNPSRKRRSVRAARRNPSRKRRSSRRAVRRNPRRARRVGGSRLSMAMQGRRNPSISGVLGDMKLLLPQAVAGVVGFGLAVVLSQKISEKLSPMLAGKVPAVLAPHVPALLCGAATVGVFVALSLAGAKGVNVANKVKGGVAIGGGIAALLLLAQSTGVLARIGMSLPSVVALAPNVVAAPAAPGAVAGMFSRGMLSDYTNTGDYTNVGDYTSTGGMDDRSQFLSGADDLTQFGGMDDAAPFAPGEGGILSGKMF